MQTEIKLSEVPMGDLRTVPHDIRAAISTVGPAIATLMWASGIKSVAGSTTQAGIRTITDVSFDPMPGNLPESFQVVRKTTVRQLCELMLLFGIIKIELFPTADELASIQRSWDQFVQQGKLLQAKDVQAPPKAPTTQDPDLTPVEPDHGK